MDPPVRVTAYVWESRPGQLSLTVACQVTFRLVHGADAQFVEPARIYDDELAAIAQADVHAPYKPRADLLVTGHAFSPITEPEVEWLLVRVRVGEYAKGARVTGDRVWVRDARGFSPGPPKTFRRMMLAPERAARSAENVRGVDPQAVRTEHRIALPNLEPLVAGQEAIFGPVPAEAPRRASMLHPLHATWIRALLAGQRPGPPAPDLPFGYFNIAPVDQQLERFPIGAAIVLEGLHPEHALFSTRLPSARVRAHVFDPGRRAHIEIEMRPDTLWIDMDREIATMVVRGVTSVAVPDAASRVTARVELIAREAPAESLSLETQMGAPQASPDLPFVRASAGARPLPPIAPPSVPSDGLGGETVRLARLDLPERPADPPAQSRRDKAFITQEIELEPRNLATPFESKPEEETTQNLPKATAQVRDVVAEVPATAPFADLEPDASTTPTAVVDTSATPPVVELVKLVPPFIPATPPPPLPPKPLFAVSGNGPAMAEAAKAAFPAPPARVVSPESSSGMRLGTLQLGALKLGGPASQNGEHRDDAATRRSSSPPPPPPPPPPAPSAAPEPESAQEKTEDTTSFGTEDTPPTADDANETTMEPPPSQSSQRLKSMGEESTDMRVHTGIEARTLEEAEAEGERDAFEFPLPPSDGHEVDGVTLEHCAAIRAAMAMPGADRAAVLSKNDLDDAGWGRIEKTHMTRIDQETSKGVMDLLQRYDAAYVAAQDRLRRPIGVEEYARIVVARERGSLTKAMTKLAIPRSELMRLDRVWKQRRAAYPDVDRAIEVAIASIEKEGE